MTRSKKLQALPVFVGSGLEAVKDDYTAIAVANPDGGFDLSVHMPMMPAHWSTNVETLEELETEMRDFVSDLRRWTWVQWD